jgi:hypothetical protein
MLPAVYRSDGRRTLREGEIEAELARKDADLTHKDEEIAALHRIIEELRGT